MLKHSTAVQFASHRTYKYWQYGITNKQNSLYLFVISYPVQSQIHYGCGGGGSGGVWVGGENDSVISSTLKLNPRDSFFVFSREVVVVGREGWQQAARRVAVAPASEPEEAGVSNGHPPRRLQSRIPAPSVLYVTTSRAGTETCAYPPGTSDHSCFLGIL